MLAAINTYILDALNVIEQKPLKVPKQSAAHISWPQSLLVYLQLVASSTMMAM